MRRRGVLAGALVAAGAMLGGCWPIFGPESVTFRYRMTVEVQTPQGLRSGSAVREVLGRNAHFLGSGGFSTPRGEAVMVELPNRETLFVLLDDGRGPIYDYGNVVPALLWPEGEFGGDQTVANAKIAISNHALIELPRTAQKPSSLSGISDLWPLMVRFKDISDPDSAEKVDPDNMPASFGSGYVVRRITIQITDEPVTDVIKKILTDSFWDKKNVRQRRELHLGSGAKKDSYFDSVAGIIKLEEFKVDVSQ